jgi:hypothetical protein
MRLVALGLRHLEHGSPAEVSALRALRRFEVLEAVAPRHAGRTALEAFDDDWIHPMCIGFGG